MAKFKKGDRVVATEPDYQTKGVGVVRGYEYSWDEEIERDDPGYYIVDFPNQYKVKMSKGSLRLANSARSTNSIVAKAINAVARNASGLDGLIADLDSGKYDSVNWMPKVIGPGTLYPDGMKFTTGFGYDDEEKVRAAWKSGKYASIVLYKGGSKRGEMSINAATSTVSEKALNARWRIIYKNLNGPLFPYGKETYSTKEEAEKRAEELRKQGKKWGSNNSYFVDVVNAKFYATGYTNGGANEKQIGPFKTKEEAIKAGREEQGASETFRFAGVIGEDGTYVYHNSRARNANSSPFGFFVGEQVVIKKDPSKKKYRVKEITETGDIRLDGATPLFDANELDTANYAGPYRSRNAVVAKAMNAARNAEDDFLQYYADSYSYIPKVGEIYKYDGKRVKCTSVQKLQRGNDDRDRFLVEGRVVG